MPYADGQAPSGRCAVPNSRSSQGRCTAKFRSRASSAAAWCQWWKRGVTSTRSSAPSRKRTFAWMKTAWNDTNTRYA